MYKGCNVCGHIGLENAIATCAKCRIAREHVYCMRVHSRVVPKIWICEACRQGKSPDSTMGQDFSEGFGHVSNLSSHGSPDRIQAGRVKDESSREEIEVSSRHTRQRVADESLTIVRCSALANTGKSLLADAGERTSDVEERNMNLLEKLYLFNDYLPALYATWPMGSFNLVHSGRMYGGFEGIPPFRIRPGVNKLTKELPRVLDVVFIHRSYLSRDLFENGRPDLRDICAYFFLVDDAESSLEKKNCLYELMETHESLMRYFLDGFELIISTSNQLCEASQKIMGNKKFLWGIYRSRTSI